MKAIFYTKYGNPEVLQLKEVEKPVPKAHEVLVKIHAASINSWDWDLLRGKPYLYRLLSGLLKPKLKILGADIAGQVESVGASVQKFKPGDAVFGDVSDSGWGGFAEYVRVHENALLLKPAALSYEQAAALPQASVLALQGIRDLKTVQAGDHVLINGAGGGVGTFALQIAKSIGAKVTAVDSAEKQEILLKLGTDHFIDYTTSDFTKNGQKYDLIIDVIAQHSASAYVKSLQSGGALAIVGGRVATLLQIASLGYFISKTGTKKLGFVLHKPNHGLDEILKLIESGKIKPMIDKCYSLQNTPEAFQYFGAGKVKGKIIINCLLEHPPQPEFAHIL
ncbi:MAG: NAD(P)-dependent alcohol dehydrogenase [Cyclobacteriaceae bacterium]